MAGWIIQSHSWYILKVFTLKGLLGSKLLNIKVPIFHAHIPGTGPAVINSSCQNDIDGSGDTGSTISDASHTSLQRQERKNTKINPPSQMLICTSCVMQPYSKIQGHVTEMAIIHWTPFWMAYKILHSRSYTRGRCLTAAKDVLLRCFLEGSN